MDSVGLNRPVLLGRSGHVAVPGRVVEEDMNGYQLTFYTEQNRHHGHRTVCEWLLHEAKQLGIHGATVINCAEGTGHAGAHHAAHTLKLADQPLQVILAVTEDEAQRMLDTVKSERVHVFYTRSPIEFGVLGEKEQRGEQKHLSLFGCKLR
jgi:PII-like signaling protein